MKILIVANYNKGSFVPFIEEQINSLKSLNVEVECFGIKGKGIRGYLKNRRSLVRKIEEYKPDIIHAHYGLSGLLANLQRKVPVVTTYHGSDINEKKVYPYSRLCIFLSVFNIFVSEKNRNKSKQIQKQVVIPCGVDVELFRPIDKQKARNILGYNQDDKLILFAGSFDNEVKNAKLAKNTVAQIENATLIELKGYSRQEVSLLMNAVDAVLMTSFSEGSPQFIKEAMACNCPVVSVDVGDVKDLVDKVEGCYISTYEIPDLVNKLKMSLTFGKTDGRGRIMKLNLDLLMVAKKIVDIYNTVLKK